MSPPISGPKRSDVTTLGSLVPGRLVNLRRSMRADNRFGGHFVQGHVDAVGQLRPSPDTDFHTVTVSFPPQFAASLIHRGSIAVDGISLTVAGLHADRFELMIIPFTMAPPTCGGRPVGRPSTSNSTWSGNTSFAPPRIAATPAGVHES